jgi:phospholipid/cholesterol/gamma-HCH transport system substrate-binding protein
MSNRADSGLAARLGDIERLSETVHGVALKTDTLLIHLNGVVAKVDEGDGTLGALIGDRAVYDSLLLAVTNTVRATEEARVGAGRFAENMEALKRNWFFRGYFEDRGYWDEAEANAMLDRKIDSLNALQRSITAQMEELNRRNEAGPLR